MNDNTDTKKVAMSVIATSIKAVAATQALELIDRHIGIAAGMLDLDVKGRVIMKIETLQTMLLGSILGSIGEGDRFASDARKVLDAVIENMRRDFETVVNSPDRPRNV